MNDIQNTATAKFIFADVDRNDSISIWNYFWHECRRANKFILSSNCFLQFMYAEILRFFISLFFSKSVFYINFIFCNFKIFKNKSMAIDSRVVVFFIADSDTFWVKFSLNIISFWDLSSFFSHSKLNCQTIKTTNIENKI